MKKCFVCGNRLVPSLKCEQGSVFICKNCGLGVLTDVPKKEKVFEYYQKFYDPKQSERFHPLVESVVYIFRLLRMNDVERFVKKKGTLLDVGFGRPADLLLFEEHGWSAQGTQVAKHVIQVAKQKGLNVFLGELQDAHYPSKKFDVVTVWHVLEHLQNPEKYIHEIHRILGTKGKLIIEVPNFGSPLATFGGCRWLGLDLPHHLYQFTPESLTLLLEKEGFKVNKKSFFSIEQSPFSALQTILNVFTGTRNILFESLKKQGKQHSLIMKLCHLLLGVVVAPFALVISILFALFRKGDVMRFYCTKK